MIEMKTQTTKLEKLWNVSPLNVLVEIKLLFLDEVDLEEQTESNDLKLVWKECLWHFVDLALDLLQEDTQR